MQQITDDAKSKTQAMRQLSEEVRIMKEVKISDDIQVAQLIAAAREAKAEAIKLSNLVHEDNISSEQLIIGLRKIINTSITALKPFEK